MTRKVLWLGSLLTVAMASAVTTRLVIGAPPSTATATATAQGAADMEALAERLGRLEAERRHSGRALAQAVQGQAATAVASTAEGPEEASAAEAAAGKRQEAQDAERESRHFDELDRQARASGGGAAAAAAAQLRSNIQSLRDLPADKGRIELDVTALECGERLCRLELASGTTATPAQVVPRLLQGMGMNLSMRPASAGRPIYYIAVRDQQLPVAR